MVDFAHNESAHECPDCGCKAWTVVLEKMASPPGKQLVQRLVCRECGFEDELPGGRDHIKRLERIRQEGSDVRL